MTEIEWFSCTVLKLMLDHLGREANARKIRLYACGYARWLGSHMEDQRLRQAVEVAELFADGMAKRSELMAAFKEAHELWKMLEATEGNRTTAWAAARAACDAAKLTWDWGFVWQIRALTTPDLVWGLSGAAKIMRCELLRDVFGNPFRPVTIDSAWMCWSDRLLQNLAQSTYDERAFDRLPILADALEEAGCSNPDILNHCRQPGEHVRGCWVVDLILGKS
ncbi:MAG TPA: hypothetical protein VMG10_27370 [Gemmataceae bacterium]|nr:hypothetical protein [Gemmataceae bacterium]